MLLNNFIAIKFTLQIAGFEEQAFYGDIFQLIFIIFAQTSPSN